MPYGKKTYRSKSTKTTKSKSKVKKIERKVNTLLKSVETKVLNLDMPIDGSNVPTVADPFAFSFFSSQGGSTPQPELGQEYNDRIGKKILLKSIKARFTMYLDNSTSLGAFGNTNVKATNASGAPTATAPVNLIVDPMAKRGLLRFEIWKVKSPLEVGFANAKTEIAFIKDDAGSGFYYPGGLDAEDLDTKDYVKLKSWTMAISNHGPSAGCYLFEKTLNFKDGLEIMYSASEQGGQIDLVNPNLLCFIFHDNNNAPNAPSIYVNYQLKYTDL